MANILTHPTNGAIYFDDSAAGSTTIPALTGDAVSLNYDGSAGLNITSYNTTSTDRFSIDGESGRLFSVNDSLTGTIFSVNDAAGLPVIEVESTSSTDTITMGTYASNALVVAGDRVGIGTASPSSSYKLDVVGSIQASSNIHATGNISATGNFESFGSFSITTIDAATGDLDKFLFSDGGTIKYRTGAQVLSDIGALSSETVTSLALTSGSLVYTDENGTDTSISLAAYLDEDSRSIASGSLNKSTRIVTFTRDDSTTFTLDLGPLLDDTNLVTSVAGKSGVVTLVKGDVGLGNVTNESKATMFTSPSFTGDVVITDDTFPFIKSSTNAVGAGIKFSGQTSGYTQQGTLTFRHSDSMSYGPGASFEFATTEGTCTILADGKLMYGEGIYSKPSSGTGAGTRKDSNWDTAYGWGNHASAGYITGNQTITLSGDASGSGTTSIAVTVANDSHNHSSSSGDFTVNGGNLYTGTSQQRVKVAVWSGTTYGIGMQSGYTFGGIGNEYVLTNQMSNTDGRGFWWGDSSHTNAQGAMALTTQGYLTVANRIRVGYGESDTTTPSKDLDVQGEASIGSLMVGATTTPAMQLQVKDTTNYHGILVNGNAAPSVCFDTSTGTTPEWKVGISGNVGENFSISKGTANDDKLTIDSSGNAAVSGNVTAYSSDERLKTNITPIENPIEKVKQLSGVEFDWKDNVEELGFTPRVKHETGVIAQNVQSVIPDATPNAPFNEEYLTVQHEKIIPVLIEAIKEQQKQIDELKQALHEQKEIK